MFGILTNQKLIYRVVRHVILFLTMVLLFSWMTSSRSVDEGHFLSGFISVLINALFFFGYAYLTVYLLIPYLLVKKRIAFFLLGFLLTGLSLSMLKFLSGLCLKGNR